MLIWLGWVVCCLCTGSVVDFDMLLVGGSVFKYTVSLHKVQYTVLYGIGTSFKNISEEGVQKKFKVPNKEKEEEGK